MTGEKDQVQHVHIKVTKEKYRLTTKIVSDSHLKLTPVPCDLRIRSRGRYPGTGTDSEPFNVYLQLLHKKCSVAYNIGAFPSFYNTSVLFLIKFSTSVVSLSLN
jgi:hypothetical protein